MTETRGELLRRLYKSRTSLEELSEMYFDVQAENGRLQQALGFADGENRRLTRAMNSIKGIIMEDWVDAGYSEEDALEAYARDVGCSCFAEACTGEDGMAGIDPVVVARELIKSWRK